MCLEFSFRIIDGLVFKIFFECSKWLVGAVRLGVVLSKCDCNCHVNCLAAT